MISLLYNIPVFHNKDHIRITNRRQPRQHLERPEEKLYAVQQRLRAFPVSKDSLMNLWED